MFAPSDPELLTQGHLRFLPVAGGVEFAAATRHAILREQPKLILVDLPPSLETPYRNAVKRLPEVSVLLCPGENEDEAAYSVVEPADPFVEALRTASEIGTEIGFIGPENDDKWDIAEQIPDPYSLAAIGYDRYVSLYQQRKTTSSVAIAQHAANLAWRLQGCDMSIPTMVVLRLSLLQPVRTALLEPQDDTLAAKKIAPVELINPHPDCLAEILTDYPFLQARYEDYRMFLDDTGIVDRPRVQLEVLRQAERSYTENTGEKLSAWHRRLIAKYTRNLALLNGQLTTGVFDLSVAARSIVDDNFGWEVWEAANRYPAQRASAEIPTENLSAQQIYRDTKRLRLRRRLPRFKQQVRPSALRKRKKEDTPGEWARDLDKENICSYPPEDLVIENYGRFLKQKAKSMLSNERERVEPFVSSLLDGIDIRETIRNWHQGQIFVRHKQRLSGNVGSVVVIFDNNSEDERYSYLTTWLGEHQNESDMAFYSTPPFDHMVGPGMGRAEYGGFLMTLPPRRMFNVWSDPDYNLAETKAERLLYAGLDYSTEKIVVYAAPKPPRSVFRTIADRLGHKILYIPLGQLSPTKLKKLRVVHVLDSYRRREEAKDYLW